MLFGLTAFAGTAQDRCATADYLLTQKEAGSPETTAVASAEGFLRQKSVASLSSAKVAEEVVIRIPVVVHILYNNASQNLSDAQIKSQLDALNRDFRRKAADTAATPARFKPLAADIKVEFYLATADPKGRATTGIVRRYTATANWLSNDKIKFASSGGDDAWDSKSYLNVWVGNLVSGAGYSSAPGSDGSRDGVVLNTAVFGTIGRSGNYSMGRAAVHEVGHWLGLKHIWGDAQCGDDGVTDTPPQSGYTQGCPNGFRSSCSNGEAGDMYMNYMDYTADACMNLFTEGQKGRMRASFDEGGPRASILRSRGLNAPWLEEASLPGSGSALAVVYPNPANDVITLNLGADFIGKTVRIFNGSGMLVQAFQMTAASQKLNIASFKAGVYFLKGEGLLQKFLKL